MSALTEQQRKDLVELTDAAGHWADELTEHIAPASESYGETETAENQKKNATDIIAAANRVSLWLDPKTCEWFASCDNAAVIHIQHPILGAVPSCQRCADKVERMR